MRQARGTARVFGSDPPAADFWLKQVLAGVFIAVAMAGPDQEVMQKNISVARLADAQTNMLLMSLVLLAVVARFLYLGGLLAQLAPTLGLPAGGDRLFPAVVLGHLPGWVQLPFVLALVSGYAAARRRAINALIS